ncbi:MAG: SDR family NAD(P)-dependent oxidoreductase [Bacteroidota bacterium]|nr:SDR family NAD(P)-dependent oxidoreductase [Bacteroidota bacterium]
MKGQEPNGKRVLITGGTSGLGFSLAKYYLNNGYEVTVTGRKPVSMPEYNGKFEFVAADFSDLKQTSDAIKQLCEIHRFDIVINNAGILSPPGLQLTNDRIEYTFQVNFLTQLLVNEITIRRTEPGHRILFAAVTSMVYEIAGKDPEFPGKGYNYNPLKAYSNSKRCLAMMGTYLLSRFSDKNIRFIAIDPGIFSSHIYRMQRRWFRIMYNVGTFFMRKPSGVAERFGRLTRRNDLRNGAIYRLFRRKVRHAPESTVNAGKFWDQCYEVIEPFLKD